MRRSFRQGNGRRAELPIGPILRELGFDTPPLRGGWTPIKCVLHGDKIPSASFNETGFFCHACNIGGDAITMLMQVRGLTRSAAISDAEKIAGISDREVRAERGRAGLIPPAPRDHLSGGDSGQIGFRF